MARRWHGPGSRVVVHGHVLPGMVYVGKPEGVLCTIDPGLEVDSLQPKWLNLPEMSQAIPYASLSPALRRAWLAWQADGRRRVDVPPGFVLLHIASIERRLLTGNPVPGERLLLSTELARLQGVYGPLHKVIVTAIATLLDEAAYRDVAQTGEWGYVPVIVRASALPTALHLVLSRAAGKGASVSFDVAMTGFLCMPHGRNMVREAEVAEVVGACRPIFAKLFPCGMCLAPLMGVPATVHSHAYKPLMRGAPPYRDVVDWTSLTDPRTLDWSDMSALVLSARAELRLFKAGMAAAKVVPNAKATTAGKGKPQVMAHAGAGAFLRDVYAQRAGRCSIDELLAGVLGQAVKQGAAPARRQMILLAAMARTMGHGMEPDPSYGYGMGAAGQAFVFPLAVDAKVVMSADSDVVRMPSYALLMLACYVAGAGGAEAVSVSGLLPCDADTARRLVLSEAWWGDMGSAEQARVLRACGRQVSDTCGEYAEDALCRIVASLGPLPSRMDRLERAISMLGGTDAHSRLHAVLASNDHGRTGTKGAIHGTADGAGDSLTLFSMDNGAGKRASVHGIPPRPILLEDGATAAVPEALPFLDPEFLARVQRDTATATAILQAAVAVDDVDGATVVTVPLVAEPIDMPEPGQAITVRFPGLRPNLSHLLSSLSARDSWTLVEVDAMARELGLLPSGAREAINEWAWDAWGFAVLDDDGVDGADVVTVTLPEDA